MLICNEFGPCAVNKAAHSHYELFCTDKQEKQLTRKQFRLLKPREEYFLLSVIISEPQNYSRLSDFKKEP